MTGFDLLLYIAVVAFGTILASFINALSFRFNTGRSVMKGRSRCMHCGHTLSALDLVPIASYVFLGGRCRYCNTRISLQYPLVEAEGAILSLLVFITHPLPLAYFFWLLVWMTLLFIVVYDVRHTVIPWSASFLLGALAILSLFVSFDIPTPTSLPLIFVPSLWSLIAGPLLALPLLFLSFVSGGRWMGWGDGPLELSLGWLLGLTMGGSALMLAFWIGAAVGIVLILLKKGLTMKSELPFAPFLILGALIAHFFHVDFLQTLPLLFY